jgi:2-methylcitrate dehydratase PrpD
MTTTDDILALAATAVPTAAAEHDLALFGEAVARGADSDAERVLRSLRPARGGPAALPDSAAWRAWLTATAAAAAAPPEMAGRFAICAAATALAATAPGNGDGDGRAAAAAVAAGTRAAELVEEELGPAGLGWSVTTVAAVIGAGLAAGMMLRLADAPLRHTLGVCATQAAGLRAVAGTDAWPLQAGKAAFNAVEAAQLAALGFTSSREPLDGRRGLFALFLPPGAGTGPS